MYLGKKHKSCSKFNKKEVAGSPTHLNKPSSIRSSMWDSIEKDRLTIKKEPLSSLVLFIDDKRIMRVRS